MNKPLWLVYLGSWPYLLVSEESNNLSLNETNFFCLTNGEAKFAFIFQTGPSYPHGSLDLVETAPGFSELPGKIDVVSFENQD
jgi:hypothetical protein